MTATYNIPLVIVSALIAIVAAYIALEVANKLFQANYNRHFWLVGGGIAMGTGIWSMHFIAMLAFAIPIYVTYNLTIVFLSLVLAVLAAIQAFYIIGHPKPGSMTMLTGSIVMGVGIALMHYTGMIAMHMPATLRYQPGMFALSVLIAVAVSFVALRLSIRFRDERRAKQMGGKLATACLMGGAVLSMHYTGMAAAIFIPQYDKGIVPSGLDNIWLAFIICGFLFVTLIPIAASLFSESL
ncbi:MAG: hypothetical protein Kow00121_41020 [Elainellaceae cyanobacterium]